MTSAHIRIKPEEIIAAGPIPPSGRGTGLRKRTMGVNSSEEFGLITGPAAEGTLFTFGADPRQNTEAIPVVERLRAKNFEPEGYTLLSYAAVQVWAQAVEKTGSLELPKVIAALGSHEFDTVLGRIDFNKKGDLTTQNWTRYVWKHGKYMPLK
jgi:branched-chain amino acid transport system substrate-binding protein